jgi:hypothetical protein
VADRHWVGGTGNWTEIAHWDEHSNGAGGDSVPTSNDDVHFDQFSFTATGQTVTTVASPSVRNLDFTGALYSPSLVKGTGNYIFTYGNIILISAFSMQHDLVFTGSASVSLTTGGHVTNGFRTESAFAGTVTLLDPISNNGVFAWGSGIFNSSNFAITCGRFGPAGGALNRTLNLGTSIVTCTSFDFTGTGGSTTTITAAAGCSIRVSGTGVFVGAGATGYQEVQFNGTSHVVSGNNTFVNLIRNGTNTKTDSVTFAAGSTQKVTGTLSLIGYSAVNRLLVQSGTLGGPATLDVDGNWNNTANVDFMDINVSHNIDLSAISGLSGDCQGNNQAGAAGTLLFTTPIAQSSQQAGNWSHTPEWSSRVPLPQDDVLCSHNMNVDMIRVGRNLTFTGSPAISKANEIHVYGSFTLVSGMSFTGSASVYLRGRSTGMPAGGWLLTSAGKELGVPWFYCPTGTYVLQDNVIMLVGGLVLQIGTLDFNDHDVTAKALAGNGGTLYMGNGTITLTGWPGVWTYILQGYSIIYCESSTLILDNSTTTGLTFGSSRTFNNVILKGSASWILTILGSNIFTSFTVDRSQANKALSITGGTTQTFANFVCATSGSRTLIIGSTNTTPATIICNCGSAITHDYIVLSYSAASPVHTWYYGANATIGAGVTGWYRAAINVSSISIWNVRKAIAGIHRSIWNTRSAHSKSLKAIWRVLTTVPGGTLQTIWRVLTTVPGSIVVVIWHTRSAPSAILHTIWHTRKAISDTLQSIWYVLTTVPGSTIQSIWNTAFARGSSVKAIWHTRSAPSKSLQTIWFVLSIVPGSTLQTIWNVLKYISSTSQYIWNTRQAISDLIQSIWNTRYARSKSLQSIWFVLKIVPVSTVQLIWNARKAISDMLQSLWHTRQAISDLIQSFWNTRIVKESSRHLTVALKSKSVTLRIR